MEEVWMGDPRNDPTGEAGVARTPADVTGRVARAAEADAIREHYNYLAIGSWVILLTLSVMTSGLVIGFMLGIGCRLGIWLAGCTGGGSAGGVP